MTFIDQLQKKWISSLLSKSKDTHLHGIQRSTTKELDIENLLSENSTDLHDLHR